MSETAPSAGREVSEFTIGDRMLVALAVVGVCVMWSVFAGAWLAAWIGGDALGVSGSDAFGIAVRLSQHLGSPAEAWPEPARSRLPGPWLYWSCTLLAASPLVAMGVWWLRRERRRLGLEKRVRLGVDAEARMADVADLDPIRVEGPTPGRMIFGRVRGQLVATEAPLQRPTAVTPPLSARSAKGLPYRPTRGSVMLVGPTQCGKSTMVICGVLDWVGPVVASSVKVDLINETFGWRSRMGECRVYDPCRVTGLRPASWSPLRGAGTWGGAQAAAHAVRSCSPPQTGENAAFFESQMERLLAGYLWTAATSGRGMRDVNRWICSQDAPSEHGPGEAATLVHLALGGRDAAIAADASFALEVLESVWTLEERTRSNIFATVQASVWPWSHPDVIGTSQGCDVDLEWLLGSDSPGRHNTLYVTAPVKSARRLAPAIGGCISDLLDQLATRYSQTGRPVDPPLLLVLDEIGNTPLRDLPELVSTLAGMGVLIVTVWQSTAQIRAAYAEQGDTVIGNHRSKVLFSGLSDPATGDLVRRLVGDEQVMSRQLSSDLGSFESGRRSIQESLITTGLIPVHVLRQQHTGSALLIHGTVPPAHLMARSQFEDPTLFARASLPIPVAARRPPPPATTKPPSRPDGAVSAAPLLTIIPGE